MPFDVVNVHIPAGNLELKEEMKKDAAKLKMSVSGFVVWMYQQWKAKQAKTKPKRT